MMTEEEKLAFIQECEKSFATRYTLKDPVFERAVERNKHLEPPVEPNWPPERQGFNDRARPSGDRNDHYQGREVDRRGDGHNRNYERGGTESSGRSYHSYNSHRSRSGFRERSNERSFDHQRERHGGSRYNENDSHPQRR